MKLGATCLEKIIIADTVEKVMDLTHTSTS